MFHVYIIYSESKDKYYIGQTSDIEKRLETHRIRKNLGANDWILKYSETFATRREAVKRVV
jgi:putative endonuclease